MIDFTCQHCGALLRMDDAFAGRDGWCRECRRMVIVPSGGHAGTVEDLPPGEAIARLQQLLSYAAKKADLYKQSQAEAAAWENSRLAQEAAVLKSQEALDKEQRRTRALESEMDSLRDALREKEARLDEMAARNDAEHAAPLEQARQQVADLEADLAGEKEARATLESELGSLRDALREKEARLEESAAGDDAEQARQQVAELESALAGEKEARVALDAEVESLRGALREKDASLEETAARHRADSAAENEQTRQMIAHLEQSLDAAQRACAASEEESGHYAAELKEIHTALERHREAEQGALERSKALEAEWASTRTHFEEAMGHLEVERDSLKTDLAAARGENEHLNAELSASRERVAEIELDCEALREDMKLARGEVEHFEKELAAMRRRLEAAEAVRDDLQRAADAPAPDAAAPHSDPAATEETAGRDVPAPPEANNPVAQLRHEAEVAGAADAQYRLGVCHAEGEGVARDGAEAVRWLTQAAEQGHANAQYELGKMLLLGTGVSGDARKAADMFSRAAEHGHAKAQFAFGRCLEYGRGMLQQSVRAYSWYSLAALQLDEARSACEKLAATMSEAEVAEGQRLGDALKQRLGRRKESMVS